MSFLAGVVLRSLNADVESGRTVVFETRFYPLLRTLFVFYFDGVVVLPYDTRILIPAEEPVDDVYGSIE